jgi:hypothetical protein
MTTSATFVPLIPDAGDACLLPGAVHSRRRCLVRNLRQVMGWPVFPGVLVLGILAASNQEVAYEEPDPTVCSGLRLVRLRAGRY